MRIQLEKVIKKKFGPVFNSHQLKYQRQEIVADVLERYDEEIRNGASEEEAYRIALNSVGDFRELRQASRKHSRTLVRNIVCCSVYGIISAAAIAACILEHRWFLLFVAVVCIVVAGIAMYRLLSGNYKSKAKTIAALAVSGYGLVSFAAVMAFMLLMIGAVCRAERHPSTYDYTEHAAQIESIRYIEITHLKYGKEADEFEYDVLETVDDNRKASLLKDLSQLKYVFYPEPPDLYEGCHGLLLCFKEGSGDIRYVLYCRHIFTVIHQTETGIEFNSVYGVASTEEWNALLDRYLKQDYGFDQYSR